MGLPQARAFPGALDARAIRSVCERYPAQEAIAKDAREDLRRGHVRWVDDPALKDEMWGVLRQINAQFYGFRLEGILEPLQYATYGPGDRFGWHMDAGSDQMPLRKLSLSVQLSESHEYKGGDLQVRSGCEIHSMPRGIGDVIAFPSWLLHRVEPVISGERHALVVWAHGDEFV